MASSKIMSKSKDSKDSTKPSKVSSAVKEGRVTKPAHTPIAKSKEVAKKAAAKVQLKDKHEKKRKVKEPTPEPESESEEESDASDEDSADSESEVEHVVAMKPKTDGKPATTASAPKLNGAAKAKPTSDDDDSESDNAQSDSSEDGSSDDENDKKTPAAPKASMPTTAGAKQDTSDESESSDDDSEAEAPAKANGVKLNGITKKADTDKSDEDDSEAESASSASGSDGSAEEKEAPPKKRKAEEPVTPAAKKSKTFEAENETPVSKNLFVGNLSWNIDEEWLAREFEGFGEIVGCRIITDRDSGRSKGYGYIDFADPESASAALNEKNETLLDGRNIRIDYGTARTPKSTDNTPQQRADRYGDKASNPSETLWIGNLPFNCTNDIVGEVFAEFGTITRVSLPTDRETGEPKGFGYVSFSSVEEAQSAFDGMNGQSISGRPVRLDFAGPKPDNGGFGGGRGGGGRGGGFGGNRGGRGGFGDRGGRGGGRGGGFRGGRGDRGGRGGTTNRGGFGDFKGKKVTF